MATAAPLPLSEHAGQPEKVRAHGCENRCIVAIGASAGGVDALKRLVREISPDIPAALLEDGPIARYRCHTGHAFEADVLMQAQADDAEQAL
ncbi:MULTISPECIES: hypothetical protein [unclassified Mesorhizobium]|uniref:hypothetical protein n=1 Tax=unclassified Mesorhizobium TaxID=325217 RepID=UPI0015E32450|nr:MULTISPECIES: hypothetical protein [unclassified Mesorhizobium]MBZ9742608.1 hypothetical protein [Mesorhizobium sp. CO1-1-4]MBZ9801283.1 hypothetical protein [Mesorhizobium sp. ES1-6]